MGALHIIYACPQLFADRIEAGRILADHLHHLRPHDLVVLGIPRGGVVIAHQIAKNIGGTLDIVLTRKLGAPYNPELAIGAVSENSNLFLNEELITTLRINSAYIKLVTNEQLEIIAVRQSRYRQVLKKVALKGKTVILTDDGVATGATMLASIWAAKAEKPKKIILAVPVGPPDTLIQLAKEADETICISAPQEFAAVGQFYREFEQVSDAKVLGMLSKS